MEKRIIMATLCAALAVAPCFAKDAAGKGRPKNDADGEQRAERFMARFDKNGDKKLDMDELREGFGQMAERRGDRREKRQERREERGAPGKKNVDKKPEPAAGQQ